eukprot:TRINITY_DN8625_c1_g1_i1.p1 TRINITY_DN8625_c1_g1~~TRINITY_DN8625_c1_g1_i1.p1  ORF type:complete len:384 (+),score=86.19 TRINITY_DN8625_c1_g1_i1:41-1153(+)
MADTNGTDTSAASACQFAGLGDYDTGLHVGAIFIIAGTSFLGTLLPIAAKKIPLLRIRELPFSCAKMFGSGIILATSLIHMLLPGIANLTNPCLDQNVWGDPGYPAWSPALCIGTILLLHATQFAVAKKIRAQAAKQRAQNATDLKTKESQTESKEKDVVPMKTDVDVEKGEVEKEEPALADPAHAHHHGHHHDHDHDGHAHAGELLFAQKEHEISTYILELGIMSHSIIIGVALGVTVAPDFQPLLIAIVFHQFFEGIALSTVVLDTKFKGMLQSLFVVIFYTFTTPIGIAIGVGIASSYNANSTGSLIAQGVLESISAGILIYDVLVNIITTHTKSPYFYSCSTRSQVLQIGCLWGGTFTMALIGKWA